MISVYKKLKELWWRSVKAIHPALFELTFRFRMYLKYVIAGGSAAVVNLSSLAIFVELFRLYYLPASVLAFCLGLIASFFLQKFFTFGHTDMIVVRRQFVMYVCIAAGNLLLNTLLVYLFVDVFRIWYLFSQVLAGILIAIESFVVYRRYVFTRRG